MAGSSFFLFRVLSTPGSRMTYARDRLGWPFGVDDSSHLVMRNPGGENGQGNERFFEERLGSEEGGFSHDVSLLF